MKRISRWGIGVFAIAILLIGMVYFCNKSYPYVFLPRNIIFVLCGVFSVVVFISGHFSYSRINNCKVYMLGYLSGLAGISYSFLQPGILKIVPSVAPKGFFEYIILLMFVNCLLICSVPSYLKYRITRSITLTAFTIEIVTIIILRFIPRAAEWATLIKFYSFYEIYFWIGPALFAITLLVSLLVLKDDFHMGGTISGIALINSIIWTFGINEFSPTAMQLLLFGSTFLFTIIGIMIHWFTKMDHRIAYDPLLKIFNRDYCGSIISEQSDIKTLPPFTIAMVDIDHFKNVNDTYGHLAGDHVLFSVAQAVRKGVMPFGIACRYGGEELAVFFSGNTAKRVVKIMEQVRIEIENLITESANKKISVTISCGVAQRDNLKQSLQQVIQAADKALYRAKKGGRNQIKSGKV